MIFCRCRNEAVAADLIYLCSPNDPTGAAYTRERLQVWVDYAREKNAVILFDAAYESFVMQPEIPHSIYEIPGAEECAVEFCFVVQDGWLYWNSLWLYVWSPPELVRCGMSLHDMWLRRQTTKFNGASYPVQRAAAAVFSEQGLEAARQAGAFIRTMPRSSVRR